MTEYSVLIIDDDIWMQRILSKSFQSYGFKKTFLASNGYDGVALATEHLPNLIVLDILMPEITGLQTLKVLKAVKATRPIPILMVSALSDAENLGMAVRNGSAGFISKPFTRATIYDKLVEVYGKEKLLQISRGEAFLEDVDSFGKLNESNNNDNASAWDVKPIDFLGTSANAAESFKVSSDEVSKAYPSDEKKTLDSIKKMLLKNK